MRRVFLLLLVFLFYTIVYTLDFKKFKVFQNNSLNKYKFPSRFELITEKVPGSGLVSIQFWIRTGAINENEKLSGISHLLEHLLFKGTAKRDSFKIQQEMETLGGSMNAATSFDYTYFYVILPAKNLFKGFDILEDMVFFSEIPDKELSKEKEVVVSEILRASDSPVRIIFDELESELYSNTLYNKRVIGTADNVRSFTKNIILSYYHKYYVPSNCSLVITGDFSENELLQFIGNRNIYFDSHKRTKLPVFNAIKKRGIVKQEVIKPGLIQKYMIIGFPGAMGVNKNTLYLDLLTNILSMGRASILYQNIREKMPEVSEISSAITIRMYQGYIYFYSILSPNASEENIKASIFAEISKLGSNISSKKLLKSKTQLEADTYFQKETLNGRSQLYGYWNTVCGGVEKLFDYLNSAKEVTVDDISNTAKEFFDKKNYFEVILKGEKKADD